MQTLALLANLTMTLAMVTEHPPSAVDSQRLQVEHIMIEWDDEAGTPLVFYASIRGEDLAAKKTFNGIQFTIDIGYDAHLQGKRSSRPRCGRYLVLDGDKTEIPSIFVGVMQKVGEAQDCNAEGLVFSPLSEIPRQELKTAKKASAAAIRFPAKSKVHMIALAGCDLSVSRIRSKRVGDLTVGESETLRRCEVIGPMPPPPELIRP